MKTINVTDEQYEFLMNLSKELNTQDNRGTAKPYFFQVRETKEVPAHKGSGEEILYHSDYEVELRTDDDKFEWIKENKHCFIGTEYENEAHEVDNYTTVWELDSMLEELGFVKFNVENQHVYINAFLTSKACDEHIRINKHNLKEPVNFLSHAFRNPELEQLLNILSELTNEQATSNTRIKRKNSW